MTMPYRASPSAPYGPGGLDMQAWLSSFQGNASPPTDEWVRPWINQNTFSSNDLTDRSKTSIEQYYLARFEDEATPIGNAWKYASDAIFDTLLSGFGNIERLLRSIIKAILGETFSTQELNLLPTWFKGDGEDEPGLLGTLHALLASLPEWLEPLQPVAEFLADTFTEAFQDTFSNLTSFLTWLWDNGVVELAKNVLALLKTLAEGTGENIVVPLLTALKDLWDTHGSLFKPVIDAVIAVLKPLVDGQSVETLNNFLNTWKSLVQTILSTNSVTDFLNTLKVFIQGIVSWGDPNSLAITVLKDLIAALVGVTDFNNWIKFFTALINRVRTFFLPAENPSASAVTAGVNSFSTIVDVFLGFFSTLNALNAQWIDVLKLVLEKLLALAAPAGTTLLQWVGAILDAFIIVFNEIAKIVFGPGGIAGTLDNWITFLVGFVNKFFSLGSGAGLTGLVDAFINNLFAFIGGVGSVTTGFITAFKTVFEAIAGITFSTGQSLQAWVNNLIAFVNKFFTLGSGSALAGLVDTFLTNLFNLINRAGDLSTNFVNAFKAFFNAFVTVSSFSQANFIIFVDRFKVFLETLFGFFTGIPNLNADFFKNIATALGKFLASIAEIIPGGSYGSGANQNAQSFLAAATNTINQIVKNFSNDVLPVTDFYEFARKFGGGNVTSVAEAIAAAQSWVSKVPLINSIIPSLLGANYKSSNGTNNTIADLVEFGIDLLRKSSALEAQNIIGSLPFDILSLIPVGSIGNARPNLVSDQAFADAAKLQAGGGWSWDGTKSAPGSSGGSAKVVGDGGVKQLFSNLVQVAPAQQLSLSAQTQWTKGTNNTPTILVAVRGYNGNTVTFTTTVASVTAKTGSTSVANSSVYTAGSGTTATLSGGWVKIAGSFTIPANTTHARLMLGVQNAPSGCTVWFDDTVMQQTSLIQQTLVGAQNNVGSLVDDLIGLLPKNDFTDLVDRVAKKTNATLADVTSVVNSFLNGQSPLNGSNIASGNIGSTFISELVDTWMKVGGGLSGTPLPAAGLDPLGQSVSDFSRTSVNNAGVLLNVIGKLSIAEDVINQLKPKVTTLESATKELQDTTTITVRPALTELQTGFNQTRTAVNQAQGSITTFRTAIGELQTGLNNEAKPAITNLQSLHNSGIKPAIGELQTGLNSQVKPAVTELQTLHNTKTKTAVEQLQTGLFTTARNAVTELQTLHNTKTAVAILELQNAVKALQTKTSTPQTAATTVGNTANSFGAVTATSVTSTTGSVPTSTATTVNSTNVTVTSTSPTSVSTSTSPTTVTSTTTTTVTNTGVTPVSPTPTVDKKNYTDDFERSSLGLNWLTYTNGSATHTLGIPDGHNARFSSPSTVSGNNYGARCVALWSGGATAPNTRGPDSYTNSVYQVVSTVLTNAPSGTAKSNIMFPGWNDLIARCSDSSSLVHLVCRFFADGTIIVFYRQNSWEGNAYSPENVIGTFTANPKPTAGSLLEFRVGNPSLSDPTRITVQVGNAAFGPIFVPSSVLSTMGRRWGFGMGNGYSVDTAGVIRHEPSAALNYVNGRDG